MKVISGVLSFFKNKYVLVLSFFVIWMLFFDHNDFFTNLERRKELQQIEASKAYYTKEIAKDSKFAADMRTNPAAIEKYAREKYLMKRDNEDLFLIQSSEKE